MSLLVALSRNTCFGFYLILPFYYSFPVWMFPPLWYHCYSSTVTSFISVFFLLLSIFLKYHQCFLVSQDTSFWYPSQPVETLYNSTCISYLTFLYPSQETRKAMGLIFKCSLCCMTIQMLLFLWIRRVCTYTQQLIPCVTLRW